jgi:hypothetical protein
MATALDVEMLTVEVEDAAQELPLHVDAAAATIVTGPAGATGGAVNTALVPLAVSYGVTDPQLHGLFGSLHCTDHLTPPVGIVSLLTAALTAAWLLTVMVEAGCTRKLTLGGIAVMLMVARPGLPPGELAMGLADRFTTPPAGIVDGAV